MASLPIGKRVLLLAVASLMGLHVSAFAATGTVACDGRSDARDTSEAPRKSTLVDYSAAETTAASARILEEPDALESAPIALTTTSDTSLRRDDHVKADLALPEIDGEAAHAPDAAAILLERRSSQARETSDQAMTTDAPEMTTELPGMDGDEMLRFRQQMYRTDI